MILSRDYSFVTFYGHRYAESGRNDDKNYDHGDDYSATYPPGILVRGYGRLGCVRPSPATGPGRSSGPLIGETYRVKIDSPKINSPRPADGDGRGTGGRVFCYMPVIGRQRRQRHRNNEIRGNSVPGSH